MSRILFFLMGLPVIVISFFSQPAQQLFENTTLKANYNGNEIVMTEEESKELKNMLSETLSSAINLPTIFVTTDELAREEMTKGYFINLIYEAPTSYDEYTFDELAFKVEPNQNYICMMRKNDDKFEGRCLYFELENDLSKIYSYLSSLTVENSDQNIKEQDKENMGGLEEQDEKSNEDFENKENEQKETDKQNVIDGQKEMTEQKDLKEQEK